MRELSLKELQSTSLQILKKVHEFCLKNEIKYSLAYGTLLGAVRHKGFIPWDDDIDIMMTRPEYERFCKSFKADGLNLYCHQNDPTCYLTYARVCDDVNTVSSKSSWRYGGGNTGLWIDIFPIDAVENNADQYKERYNKARYYYFKLFRFRAFLNGWAKENSLKLNCFAALLKIWPFSTIMKKKAYQFVDEAVRFQSEIPFGSTEQCSQITLPNSGSAKSISSAIFDSYRLMKFEDTSFFAVKDYDSILKNWYGDYMILPPESERIPAHHAWHSFFWKDNG